MVIPADAVPGPTRDDAKNTLIEFLFDIKPFEKRLLAYLVINVVHFQNCFKCSLELI